MKSLYVIEGMSTLKHGMGHCGVSITLDGRVANAIWKNKLRRNPKSPLVEEMKIELDNKYGRIDWVEDSWLLRMIMVESSQCSCFGLNGDHPQRLERKEHLKWTPHNIDTPHQAAKIVALWLYWFNNVSCLPIGKKTLITSPFAI
jgi:hypothetical protein